MLSRPTFVVWLISTILAVAVIGVKYAGIDIPVVSDIAGKATFEVLLLSYLLLWAGTVFKGI